MHRRHDDAHARAAQFRGGEPRELEFASRRCVVKSSGATNEALLKFTQPLTRRHLQEPNNL